MEVKKSQEELRHTYVGGGPGAIVSALVWLAAGITAVASDLQSGFFVLFFAGMFIFPISKVVLNLIWRRDSESNDNQGGLIVIETVFPMIFGLFAAWLLLPYRPDYVFALAAIFVGAHYFGFRSAYGDWTYWIFASMLCGSGLLTIFYGFPAPKMLPFVVSAIEFVFGIWFIGLDRKRNLHSIVPKG